MKVELHVHTDYSYDTSSSLSAIIRRCKHKGIDAIGIADHNEIEGALRLAQIAPFRVIIGEEVLTKEGEIIGFFISRHIRPGMSMARTISEIKKQNGIVYLPHPFDTTTRKTAPKAIEKFIGQVDIVEVHNGRTVRQSDNKRAREFAEFARKPMAVGSDAHTVSEIGRNYQKMSKFNSPKSFIKALEKAEQVTSKPFYAAFAATKWSRRKKKNFPKKYSKAGKWICDLCGGGEYYVVYTKRGTAKKNYLVSDDSYGVHPEIIRCRACGLQFVHPRGNTKKVESRYVHYKDELYESQRKARVKGQERYLRGINKHSRIKGRILDVGAATGTFLEASKRDGWREYGIEPSIWASKTGREQGLNIYTGNLKSRRFRNLFFDAVALIDVIEHMGSPDEEMREIRRIMRRGGVLCVVTPDKKSLAARILGERWWHVRPDHLYYFSKETLMMLLRKHGYEILEVRRDGWRFSHSYWLSRLSVYVPIVKKFDFLFSRERSIAINFFDSITVYARKT